MAETAASDIIDRYARLAPAKLALALRILSTADLTDLARQQGLVEEQLLEKIPTGLALASSVVRTLSPQGAESLATVLSELDLHLYVSRTGGEDVELSPEMLAVAARKVVDLLEQLLSDD